jgi:hypothetical protein
MSSVRPLLGLTAGRRQRNPAGVLAVIAGVASDVAGAVGGVVVVTVASGADLTVPVPACSLATATATATATAPMTTTAQLLLENESIIHDEAPT